MSAPLVQCRIDGELGSSGIKYCAGGFKRMEKAKGLEVHPRGQLWRKTMDSELGVQKLALT